MNGTMKKRAKNKYTTRGRHIISPCELMFGWLQIAYSISHLNMNRKIKKKAA